MKWVLWFTLLCFGGLAAVVGTLAAFGWLSEVGRSLNFAIAVALAILLCSALAGLLMGLVFYSNRSGADERVGGSRSERESSD